MSKLMNRTSNIEISANLEIAESFISRGIGLLKYSNLESQQALWIHKCNSIHTFFMRFTIDCVFVDKNLVVKSLFKEVRPWRLILPQRLCDSVFELPCGLISDKNIQKGDQLYVVS